MVGHIPYALNDTKTDYEIADGDVDVDAVVLSSTDNRNGLRKVGSEFSARAT